MGHARKTVGIHLCFDHLIQGKFKCNLDRTWSMYFFGVFTQLSSLRLLHAGNRREENHYKITNQLETIKSELILFFTTLIFYAFHFVSKFWLFFPRTLNDNQKLFSTDCQGFWNWLRLFTDHGIETWDFSFSRAQFVFNSFMQPVQPWSI